MDKLILDIDITDWLEDVMRSEMVVTDEQSIIELLANGAQTGEVAKAVVVNRKLGNAPPDILQDDKINLYSGTVAAVAQKMRRVKVSFETESGKTYEAAAYIGAVRQAKPQQGEDKTDEPIGPSYISTVSKDGMKRAQIYLERVLPGHIFERFKEIYMNGGDVEAEASKLAQRVYQLAHLLTREKVERVELPQFAMDE